jgi:hypothetical protein
MKLTPTVTAALVNAVSTLWQIKKPALTHKLFSINNNNKLGFLLFHTMTQNTFSLHKHSKKEQKEGYC